MIYAVSYEIWKYVNFYILLQEIIDNLKKKNKRILDDTIFSSFSDNSIIFIISMYLITLTSSDNEKHNENAKLLFLLSLFLPDYSSCFPSVGTNVHNCLSVAVYFNDHEH